MLRSRLSRVLRLVLAVLTLVVHDAGIARAILNAPCARPGTSGAPSAPPAASSSMVDVPDEGAEPSAPRIASDHVEADRNVPLGPALATPCVSSASVVAPFPVVPAADVVWSALAHPLGPEAHLSSRAPSPPLRLPRAT